MVVCSQFILKYLRELEILKMLQALLWKKPYSKNDTRAFSCYLVLPVLSLTTSTCFSIELHNFCNVFTDKTAVRASHICHFNVIL